jgi:hypothetical protein
MKPKEWRLSEKLTLVGLSELMGFSDGYISDVENGVRGASGRMMSSYYRVSKGLVTPADFEALAQDKAG